MIFYWVSFESLHIKFENWPLSPLKMLLFPQSGFCNSKKSTFLRFIWKFYRTIEKRIDETKGTPKQRDRPLLNGLSTTFQAHRKGWQAYLKSKRKTKMKGKPWKMPAVTYFLVTKKKKKWTKKQYKPLLWFYMNS